MVYIMVLQNHCLVIINHNQVFFKYLIADSFIVNKIYFIN